MQSSLTVGRWFNEWQPPQVPACFIVAAEGIRVIKQSPEVAEYMSAAHTLLMLLNRLINAAFLPTDKWLSWYKTRKYKNLAHEAGHFNFSKCLRNNNIHAHIDLKLYVYFNCILLNVQSKYTDYVTV